MIYQPKLHKKAFELYLKLGSYRQVASNKGMPSKSVIAQWASKDYRCKCPYHNWERLKYKIQEEVRERQQPNRTQKGTENQKNENSFPEEIQEEMINGGHSVIPAKDFNKIITDNMNTLKLLKYVEALSIKGIYHEETNPKGFKPSSWREIQRSLDFVYRNRRIITGQPDMTINHRVGPDLSRFSDGQLAAMMDVFEYKEEE